METELEFISLYRNKSVSKQSNIKLISFIQTYFRKKQLNHEREDKILSFFISFLDDGFEFRQMKR